MPRSASRRGETSSRSSARVSSRAAMSSGPVGGGLAGEDDDPRRALGRQRIAPARLLAGLPDGGVAGELEGEERRDPVGRDPLQLVRRVVAEQHEPPARTGLVGGCRDRDPERGGGWARRGSG